MNTPIYDFLVKYRDSGITRMHMPGHKGVPMLGPEPLDLTEIKGADSLYEADGIIAESERNASKLFGTAATFYSTEGSSLCVRTMLRLATHFHPKGTDTTILAVRNVHQSFIAAATLLDFPVQWMYPDGPTSAVSCLISPARLEYRLRSMAVPPAAVYVTSPDYMGGMQDIAALADICHRYGTRLVVDNAHGAYMHFMPNPAHPIDLGADLCCDSAHKTLPVLTGGAYLHLSKSCPRAMIDNVKLAMGLFGSTSPSYLILASLDLCNKRLSEDFPEALKRTLDLTGQTKQTLRGQGWQVYPSDPMRISIRTDGPAAARRLREGGIEPEYVDRESVVLMTSPGNTEEDYEAVPRALGKCDLFRSVTEGRIVEGRQVLRMHDTLACTREIIPVAEAAGRICADPKVHCPPGIPIVMPGERIEPEHLPVYRYFDITDVLVVKQ